VFSLALPASARHLPVAVTVLALMAASACNRNAAPAAAGTQAAAPAATKDASAKDSAAATKDGATKDPAAKDGATKDAKDAKAAPKDPKQVQAEKDRARLAAAEAVPVEIGKVTRGSISAFLSFNSTLETEAIVDLYPQTGGQVEALLVEEGRIVQEGEPLLKIEDRELRVDADESTANFEHLKANFARTEDLFKRNLINKQEYDDQRFQVEQARLRLERAKLRLSYATVRAPFAGVIAARETQVGARVGTGTKLFSIVKLDEIVARVFVPGRYLPDVKENQPAVVTSEFLRDRTFKGWVKRISPIIDPKSGTFKVTVGVRGDKPSDLPPGLFVSVRVITDTRDNALLIPKRAVVYEGGERYVFAVVNGKASKRKLVAGYEDPMNIEAMSGFEVGADVIVLGQSGLKDGAMVRPVNAPAAPTPPPGAPPAGAAKQKKDDAAKSDAPAGAMKVPKKEDPTKTAAPAPAVKPGE
jgi:membrane fusion protein, multidrug efflux system